MLLAWVLAAASILWMLLLTGATAFPSALVPMRALAFALASFICHQQPDRSFHWGAAAWPVCARCLGLYAAAPMAAVAALLAAAPRRFGTPAMNVLLLCIAAIPTAITWVGEHIAGWPMSNAARFAAALPLGAGAAWLLVRTVRPKYTL